MPTIPDLEAVCRQARRCLRRRDYPQAVRLFQEVLAVDGQRVDVHEGMATACFLSQQFEKAAEHFRRITEIDPWKPQGFVNLGAVYNRMGRPEQAIEALRKALQKDRKSSEAYYNLGIAHRQLGQNSMAVSAYREAIRLNPRMAEAHVNLANVYRALGNNQQAMVHYRNALDLDPECKRAHRGMQKAQEAVQELKRSMTDYSRVDSELHDAQSAINLRHGDEAAQPAEASQPAATASEADDVRSEYQQITRDVIDGAWAILEQIRTEVEPALQSLNRSVSRGTDSLVRITGKHEDFQRAVEKMLVFRIQLEKRFREIEESEAMLDRKRTVG